MPIFNMKSYLTHSPFQTIRIAKDLAKNLKRGDVVGLFGELGSGKTTFVKGLAKGLGYKEIQYINSPSFVIIKEYRADIPIYHFDLYRLSNTHELEELGFEEYFWGNGICVIEWADKAEKLLPRKRIKIRFITVDERTRKIYIYESPRN